MNKLGLTTIMLVVALSVISGSALAEKLGYMNSQTILEKYSAAKEVRAQLEELDKGWEKKGLEMQSEIQGLAEQLEAQRNLLSEANRLEKEQEIQMKYMALQQFQSSKWGPQGEGRKREAQLMEPVEAKIIAAINVVGAQEGYDYIFDVVDGTIIYAGENQVDLTERILEELEKGK